MRSPDSVVGRTPWSAADALVGLVLAATDGGSRGTRADRGSAPQRRARLICLGLLSCLALTAAPRLSFSVVGADPGGWPLILSAMGFQPAAEPGHAGIVVLRQGAKGEAADYQGRLDGGAFLILEGPSEVAESLGFHAGERRVHVQSVEDLRRPELRIVWAEALDLPVFEVPPGARVFARERWQKAPLVAGMRRGAGAILWVAAPPGPNGYERLPYLPHALRDLGLDPPLASRRLWAFFDSSYRSRADVDYLARRWRRSGIAALQVAAWHNFEPDAERDAYLRSLIRACHRNAILVYAWLELPHVSERFWQDHPEWREKTAVLQDAALDWRKLMNLANRDCFHAAAGGVRELIGRFDWDGINLAELYFESLEGAANPSRLTPMNGDVRREFRASKGFDPMELFAAGKSQDAARLRAFLDYRAALAERLQREWIAEMDSIRRDKPDLDLVLTHIDDRFDTGMRDALGADAARLLPLLDQHDFTFAIEDPATVWNLGPQRYTEIAKRYQALTKRTEKLAVDINVVDRYQDVYPTKQQTGTELFELVASASRAFPRVMLYFENSILASDLPLLAAAGASARLEQTEGRLAVESARGIGVVWNGPARVDGRAWPASDGEMLWLPAGAHTVEAAKAAPATRILDFNGDLESASATTHGLEFGYVAVSRAVAALDRKPLRQQIDGAPAPIEFANPDGPPFVVILPRGQHLVELEMDDITQGRPAGFAGEASNPAGKRLQSKSTRP